MYNKLIELNSEIIEMMGYVKDENKDLIIENILKNKNIIKPCEKLDYCPYWYLVEYFPLLPSTKQRALKWYNNLKSNMDKWEYIWASKARIEKMISNFNLENHPDEIPQDILNMKCPKYWHLCPAYFLKENIDEN